MFLFCLKICRSVSECAFPAHEEWYSIYRLVYLSNIFSFFDSFSSQITKRYDTPIKMLILSCILLCLDMAHLQNINSYNYGLWQFHGIVFHIPNSILVIYKFASICKFEIKMFHVPYELNMPYTLHCQNWFFK